VSRPLRAAAGLLLAAAAVLGGWWWLRGRGPRPDIVVLLWDTTRADRLSAYGYARDTTPWLKDLAARGVLYEQCRAPAPWTVPSHASLFTGLLPRHHGATALDSQLAPSHRTLAERLQEAGYDTVLVTNNALVGRENGLDQGFATFRLVQDPGTKEPSADLTVDVVAEVLAARKADPGRARRPLFLFVNLLEPHLPYDPPAALERPWRPEGATEAEVREAKQVQFPRDMEHNLRTRPLGPGTLAILPGLYDAEILRMDAACARMEKVLAAAGVLAPGSGGILVVTADHGENLGDHGLLDHKLSVADRLLRIPLVVRWPGRLEGGGRVKEQVRLQDLFPTLLEAGGVPPGPGEAPHAASLLDPRLDGRAQVSEFPAPLSFVASMRTMPAFAGLPDDVYAPMHVSLLAATAPPAGGRRLKWERRTRVAFDGTTAPLGESLFDLEADPGEDRDLLAAPVVSLQDVEEAKRLARIADDWTAPPK